MSKRLEMNTMTPRKCYVARILIQSHRKLCCTNGVLLFMDWYNLIVNYAVPMVFYYLWIGNIPNVKDVRHTHSILHSV